MSARLFCGSRAELHNEGSLNMQFYRFDGSLKSSGDTPPEKWENALAVLTSREAEEIPLPPELVPPEMPPMVNQTQFCVLKMQQKRMTGSIHIPARHQRRAIRFTFAWSGENLLLLDDGGFVSGFIERMTALVPKFADGANDFLAELLIDLIQGDPGYIQHLESRLDELEKSVLDGETSKFIRRMSVVRKELNRNNRMYAQLSEFAESLQEDASELFDISSSKRLSYFLRRAEHLRSETQNAPGIRDPDMQRVPGAGRHRAEPRNEAADDSYHDIHAAVAHRRVVRHELLKHARAAMDLRLPRRDRSRSAHRRGAHHMVQAQEMAVTRAVLFRAGARDLNFTCSPYVNYHKKGIL